VCATLPLVLLEVDLELLVSQCASEWDLDIETHLLPDLASPHVLIVLSIAW